jgi:hypothetical protein
MILHMKIIQRLVAESTATGCLSYDLSMSDRNEIAHSNAVRHLQTIRTCDCEEGSGADVQRVFSEANTMQLKRAAQDIRPASTLNVPP